jgi:enoyl-CoA hydratase/carnithine racemase
MPAALAISEMDGVVLVRAARAAESVDEVCALGAELEELERQLRERLDPVSAVVFESAGSPFFIAAPASADVDEIAGPWSAATAAVAALIPPTVAVAGDDVIGPALDLALACDFRILSAGARLGSGEVGLGRLPVGGAGQRLARLIGPQRAFELLLTGRLLSAADALALGLVSGVEADAQDRRMRDGLLDDLRAGAPLALAYVKEAIRAGIDLPLADGLRLEADLSALLQTTEDRAEGLRAFHDRRPPDFSGR